VEEMVEEMLVVPNSYLTSVQKLATWLTECNNGYT